MSVKRRVTVPLGSSLTPRNDRAAPTARQLRQSGSARCCDQGCGRLLVCYARQTDASRRKAFTATTGVVEPNGKERQAAATALAEIARRRSPVRVRLAPSRKRLHHAVFCSRTENETPEHGRRVKSWSRRVTGSKTRGGRWFESRYVDTRQRRTSGSLAGSRRNCIAGSFRARALGVMGVTAN